MKLGYYFSETEEIIYFDIPKEKKICIVNALGMSFIVTRNNADEKVWSIYEFFTGILLKNGFKTKKQAMNEITESFCIKTEIGLNRYNLPKVNEPKERG